MTAPFAKLVNEKHDSLILIEKQDQVISMVTSNRRVKAPAKKKHSVMLDIFLAMVFIIVLAVAVYVATAAHHSAPNINGTPISEMPISEQLERVEEVRYND